METPVALQNNDLFSLFYMVRSPYDVMMSVDL
jgi:hypothetical protein